ncbi:MAG: hypothetical protein M9887_01235 [Chitinophagales bacterium]|nr:hypothetical protein [Chitinophagales bacterium]
MCKRMLLKRLILLLIGLVFCDISFAQNEECSQRYRSKVFSSIEFHGNKGFNAWTKYHGGPTLRYDVYAPKGDTATLRPLIVLWHGGAFIDAVKKQSGYS